MTKEEENAIIYQYEKVGRDKFHTLCVGRNIHYFDNPIITAHYDGIVYHHGRAYVVEIKDRDAQYESCGTYLLENDKYINLNKAIEETGAYGAYYVNFFGDTAYVFDATAKEIADTPIEWRWCKERTAYGDKRVWKEVKMIDKELAHKFFIG